MRLPPLPAIIAELVMNGIGVGTEEMEPSYISIDTLLHAYTLDSDASISRDRSTERGVTGVDSSLSC